MAEGKYDLFLRKLNKPLLEVSAKLIPLNSLNSIKQCSIIQVNPQIPKTEYKPPKKIGETYSIAGHNPIMGSHSKLDDLEDQIVNVLGYVQTLWKESEFVKLQDKSSASPVCTQIEEEDAQKTENSVIIAQDLTGIDFHITKAEVPIKVEPKIVPEEPKVDPKAIMRSQMIEKLMEQIPDYEYLLLGRLVHNT